MIGDDSVSRFMAGNALRTVTARPGRWTTGPVTIADLKQLPTLDLREGSVSVVDGRVRTPSVPVLLLHVDHLENPTGAPIRCAPTSADPSCLSTALPSVG